jgi:hypothetical protein
LKEDLRKKARHMGREVLAVYSADTLKSISEFVGTMPSSGYGVFMSIELMNMAKGYYKGYTGIRNNCTARNCMSLFRAYLAPAHELMNMILVEAVDSPQRAVAIYRLREGVGPS